jgi:PAS domain S-box-containing protein
MNKNNTWAFLKVFIPFICAVVALCTFIVLPPFKALEQSELTRNLDRCQATLQSEAKKLSIMTKDWAEWNDTYTFVQNGNKKFIEDNLEWNYLNEALELDTLYIISLDGQIVWGETSRIEPASSISLPQEILVSILPHGAIFQTILAGEPVSGLFPAPDGYWLIVANQILKNTGEGSIKGIMVMGKFLSHYYFSTLSNQLQLDFTLQRPPKHNGIAAIQNDPVGSKYHPLSSDKTQAFRQIDDLAKSTSTWIAITAQRDIYNQGLNTALFSGVVLIVMGAGFAFLWVRITEKTSKLQNTSLQLIEKQNLLEKGQELGQLGSWEYDADLNVFTCTEMGNRIYGIPNGYAAKYELFLKRIHPDDREYFDQEWKTALKKGTLNVEHRIVINGAIKWVIEKAEMEFDEEGKAVRGVGFTQDITERKKAASALKESEDKFKSLVEKSINGIFTLNDQQEFTFVNQACCKILGCLENELMGSSFQKLLSDESQQLVIDRYKKRQQGEQVPSRYEFSIVRKSGEKRMVETSSTVMHNREGKPVTIAHLSDITERKIVEEQRLELETQLSQKHKMEAVGYMAGGMAHNFNNNLGIILGNVELSLMKQPPSSEVIPLLKNAKIAVERSRDLIMKIITYSRQGIQQKAPMHLTTITDETISLLRSTLPTTVALQTTYGPDCHATLINADASQIQAVLINLCNNAIQAMQEKGELKIQLEPAELTQRDIPAQYDCLPGRYAKLSVQDSGCGMAAEMLDKIFDPFYTTKEAHEGAGMGLATVQGIVAQHGGFIKVNSVPDQGTTFNLYFPIIEQTHLDDPTAEDTTLPRGTERILFVDDDKMLASLGEKLLTEMGYQVSVMNESTEALKMFAVNAEHFSLVITEQTMPLLSGTDLIEELIKVNPDIPTFLCTGYSSKIDEAHAKELGINAFMMKPLDLIQLAQTVRKVLDGVDIE